MGAERKSAVIGDKERKVTAYHEAGHALLALLLPQTDPLHKVTIVPRGRALGVTQQLPTEDRYTMTKDYATNRIAVLMGGRAAEEIIFGEITTGAGNDIQVATDTARRMVCEWGMSDVIGPLRYASTDTNPFLGQGGTGATARPYSEDVAQKIDAELHRIVTEQYDVALTTLRDNYHLLELMSQALLEFEVLDAEEIDMLVEYERLDELRERRRQQAEEEQRRSEEERQPKTGFNSKIKDQLENLTKPTLEGPSEAY